MKNQVAKVVESYNRLPVKTKRIVTIGVGIAVVLVLKKVYDFFLRDDISVYKQNKQLTNNVDQEIAKWRIKGLSPTYPESQYNLTANQIYDGMRYAAGDDYGNVETNLKKMNNNLDVAMLVKAFGFRQDYLFGIPEGEPKDLFTFVKSELGNEYFGITSYRLKNINANWKGKGITYTI
jgi:hypothetical protein